jgi:hypothetical protein
MSFDAESVKALLDEAKEQFVGACAPDARVADDVGDAALAAKFGDALALAGDAVDALNHRRNVEIPFELDRLAEVLRAKGEPRYLPAAQG